MKIKNLNLYLVELGKLDKPGWSSYGGDDYYYVLADDYVSAAQKAEEYRIAMIDQSIVTEDGSLKVGVDIGVKHIKMVADKIIY